MTFIDPQQKLFAHLDRLAALQAGRVAAPINVEIDLSNRCSLGCEWCHFAYTHVRGPLKGKQRKPEGWIPGGDLMDTALAVDLLRQLAEIGGISVTWTGGGEPTLHPDFDLIVSAGADLGVQQAIYTHGGHITEERAALLKRALTFVYVSLDAADPDSYRLAKGVDRFAAACDGIRRLVAAEGPATVGVGYLVTERNWGQSGEAVRLVKELGADYVQFRPTVRYDQDEPDQVDEDTGWIVEALEMLEALAEYFPELVVVDTDRFRMYQGWQGHGYPTCWWSGLQSVVTPNGKMWTCVNKREHPAALVGDLSQESFQAIWSRRPLARVDEHCRVMCRGHLANLALDGIMAPRDHPAFV